MEDPELLIRVAEVHGRNVEHHQHAHCPRIAAVTLTGLHGTIVQATELAHTQRVLRAACPVPHYAGSPPSTISDQGKHHGTGACLAEPVGSAHGLTR